MEGNSELDINLVFDELFDPWYDTASGDCNMSSS
jgi:hypothetical protein